jgi:hypothetical protein
VTAATIETTLFVGLLVERVQAVLQRAISKDGTNPKEAVKVLERRLLRMDP